ncbi:hypothetical protein LUZ63_000612 [Rhynchospora breviuscula]|uniref:PGG domain-containing protein n=1 Tax=Rhynchospora breviuscula TaxID=2022672 RepID=A0A9Q0CVP9_9POAL|nr:hypothetical protein LUZ63_000612 [Rhynchospora breviuscula]
MSHEINLTPVPSTNDGPDESQLPRPPPQACITSIQQEPPPAATQIPHDTAQMAPPNGEGPAGTNDTSRQEAARKKWFKDMRGWIMVVAVLVASVTYTSSLNPPGGFWQDDLIGPNGHEAGSSILHDKHQSRYTTFFYANATAFMASLVIIILLMNEKFYCNKSKVVMLNISMVLGLVSLMISYAAGCARRFTTSIYVIILAVGVLLFVIYSAHVLSKICNFLGRKAPCLIELSGLGGIFSGSARREERVVEQTN